MDLATIDHLLSTTRSVRKRFDFSRPVDLAVVERCLELALQAPTGGNRQSWQWVVVTDAAKRKALGELYRKGFENYVPSAYRDADKRYAAGDPRREQLPRVLDSASWLAEHMGEAPVLIVPCIEGRIENAGVLAQASIYGSILPAVWSLMLALRSRGLGSAWTTIHLTYEKEAAALLGIPEKVTQAALLPVAHYKGDDFQPAKRLPVREVTHWEQWGAKR